MFVSNLYSTIEQFTTPGQVKEPLQKTHDLSYQNTFLLKLFDGEEGICTAISLLRKDRLSNSEELTLLIKTTTRLIRVNEEFVQSDPLLSLLILTLNNDPAEDNLRDQAAENYIKTCLEDKRFEKAYAYLKVPHILVAHLLIITNQWKCANPDNKEFYDEQMAGLFQGTVAFDKGDQVSREELLKIQSQEGENTRFPIAKKLVEKGGGFEVKEWCCTPPMCSTETRLDDLFIASRRMKQEHIMTDYICKLKETSAIIQDTYGLSPSTSAVITIIGPYGVGKSRFIQEKFSEKKNITSYSLDKLNAFLMESASRPQDHHFEAMMLTNRLLSKLSEIPALLTETAAIDEFRFNRMINRDFASRSQIIIEEIAPENTSDVVKRFIEREGLVDQSRLGTATTAANDALKFRSKRIEKSKENPKIHYTLYCNPPAKEGNVIFIEVAQIRNSILSVANGQEELYKTLVN